MSRFSAIKHLSKEDIIKNGCIFTSKALVDLVLNQCEQYITPSTTILELGAGYGAFIDVFQNRGKKCIGTDVDATSIQLLRKDFPDVIFYHENSLSDVRREKYQIQEKDPLLIVGNPPYNDITSEYQNGKKGGFECDEDLSSRDMGIAFLKAYNKLKADYICVLHPLSYLIKKKNFEQLGEFRKNYRLLSAVAFPSKMFETIQKSKAIFPVVAALYERDACGMEFEDIAAFPFELFGSDEKFSLKKVQTIDGSIKKYPTKNSVCPLQFYTQRDINALLRNKGFLKGPVGNGVDVTIENLYQYAWLSFLKENFDPPKYAFIYGNLSPLYSPKIERDEIKKLLASYAYQKNAIVSSVFSKAEIESQFGALPQNEDYSALNEILNELYL